MVGQLLSYSHDPCNSFLHAAWEGAENVDAYTKHRNMTEIIFGMRKHVDKLMAEPDERDVGMKAFEGAYQLMGHFIVEFIIQSAVLLLN